MTDNKWTVEGRSFRTQYDYNAAVRDKKKTDAIRSKTDAGNIQALETLQKELKDGKHQFETVIGRDFQDEIEGLLLRTKQPSGVQTSLQDCDEAFKQEVLNQLKRRERNRRILIAVFAVIAVCSLGYFTFYYYYAGKSSDHFSQLADLKNSEVLMNTPQTQENEQQEPRPILDKYKTLYNKNKNLIGWVKIDDTIIDYPVMQIDNQDYYLDHNYEQEKDRNGSIFMERTCDAMKPSTNLIIYGHNMKSGKMFGSLEKYTSKDYYDKHGTVDFDTIYEEGTYQIMYVFRSKLYSEEEIVFKYYQFTEAATEEEFYSNMNEMAAMSLYDTGVSAQYGDKLLTLSTCDYEEENGRFVVVAKKIA